MGTYWAVYSFPSIRSFIHPTICPSDHSNHRPLLKDLSSPSHPATIEYSINGCRGRGKFKIRLHRNSWKLMSFSSPFRYVSFLSFPFLFVNYFRFYCCWMYFYGFACWFFVIYLNCTFTANVNTDTTVESAVAAIFCCCISQFDLLLGCEVGSGWKWLWRWTDGHTKVHPFAPKEQNKTW